MMKSFRALLNGMKFNVFSGPRSRPCSLLPVILLALISLLNLGASNRAARLVKEGNQLFEEEKYQEALSKYNQAQQELPESRRIFFNLGDVYYRQSEYEKADSLFNKSRETKDLQLQADAFYNQGNARFREGKFKEALDAYKKSIEINERDLDSKFNYELTRLKLQEEEQKKQEEEKQKKEEEDKEKKEEESQPQPQPSPSPAEEKQQDQQPQEQQEKEMSQEDVERLLDSLLSEEEDQREIRMRESEIQMPEVLRDW